MGLLGARMKDFVSIDIKNRQAHRTFLNAYNIQYEVSEDETRLVISDYYQAFFTVFNLGLSPHLDNLNIISRNEERQLPKIYYPSHDDATATEEILERSRELERMIFDGDKTRNMNRDDVVHAQLQADRISKLSHHLSTVWQQLSGMLDIRNRSEEE